VIGRPRAAGVALAALLCLSAAAPPNPPPGTSSASGPPVAPAIHRVSNAAIIDQFLMLAYDADPASGTPARDGLARWLDEQRLFVSGGPSEQAAADSSAAILSRLTGLPMFRVQGGQPNVFLAVTADPVGNFQGALRPLLLAALAGENDTVDRYIDAVVARQPCWVLPVWADRARHVIKAAVIGVHARQGHPGIERCILRELAAALGLLGPAGTLPRSVFTPESGAIRLSLEDQAMLRMLYSPALSPGMARDQAAAAAAADIARQPRAR
jgi:hypothetical protein